MEIKKFDQLEELNEDSGLHPGDRDQLVSYGDYIRKFIPTFDVFINGNYGEIHIDNITRFKTQGPSTTNVILAYVSGMMTGLRYIKK